jgi:hypothetical protein
VLEELDHRLGDRTDQALGALGRAGDLEQARTELHLDVVERLGVVPVGVRQEELRVDAAAPVFGPRHAALGVGEVADPGDPGEVAAQPPGVGVKLGHGGVDARLGDKVHVSVGHLRHHSTALECVDVARAR